jgi:hypothetical protein
MPKVNISNEILQRLRAFQKIIDYVRAEEFEKESDYVGFVLSIGMDKMFEDLVPEDEASLLSKTLIAMFNENPDFVADFFVNKCKKGEEIEKERDLYKKHIKKE